MKKYIKKANNIIDIYKTNANLTAFFNSIIYL